MDDNLLCERCGLELIAVISQGFDLYGNRVLRPEFVKNDEGLFVVVRCPVHGKMLHRVVVTGEAPEPRQLDGPAAASASELR